MAERIAANLTGRTILVTGASAGIGPELAPALERARSDEAALERAVTRIVRPAHYLRRPAL
jgi:NADP-dependent 3-hydroxy acid dehydrogenase YdfG